MARATFKLGLLKRWAQLRASPALAGVGDRALFDRVAAEARQVRPGLRVSGRSLRRWREAYNRIAPDGLAAGLAALFEQPRGPDPSPR